MASSCIHLTAPLSGYSRPINEVPDPVFAEKIVGDGIAIDPTSNILKSPCNAIVTSLHQAKHAISLQTSEGVEILLHIGIDTVLLNGQGLSPKVAVGDKVKGGQELIEFDADLLAMKAKSLLTTIVITNKQRIFKQIPTYGQIDAENSRILSLYLVSEEDEQPLDKKPAPIIPPALSEKVTINNQLGLHARPAAALAHLAKSFPEAINLVVNEQKFDAKSMIAIMGLNLQYGDQIQFEVSASHAQKIIRLLSEAIAQGLGENENEKNKQSCVCPQPKPKASNHSNLMTDHCLSGIAASQGIVAGHVFQLKSQQLNYDEEAKDKQIEQDKLKNTLKNCKNELHTIIDKIEANNPEQANIFRAHYELLEDPSLISQTLTMIELGKTAAFSWYSVIEQHKNKLKNLKNSCLASRVVDLSDIRTRVLRKMLGMTDNTEQLPANSIIIAQELTPSDTVKLDKNKVVGFCTTLGGASSHVAIIARSMGLPAITGINTAALSIKNNSLVILDGNKGILDLDVNDKKLQHLKERQTHEQKLRNDADSGKNQAAITLDNTTIKVAANIGSIDEAISAQQQGADGIGLLRSEFLYLDKTKEPTETEQQGIYRAIAQSIESKTLTIRTLDVGGDKPLPYLTPAKEDNPSLGVRGIRMGLNTPAILQKQLKAILQSAPSQQIRILFPMVAKLNEFIRAKEIVKYLCSELKCPLPQLGIMIEVPSSALLSEHFAAHVDFFSIGTNDLTQYTLAIDRGHPLLSTYIDGLHPAVLQLIAMTVKGAKEHNVPVSVCGCLASDACAVPILIGLGVTELSVAVPTLPLIKSQIRQLSYTECQQLATEALQQTSASDVRALSINPSEQVQ